MFKVIKKIMVLCLCVLTLMFGFNVEEVQVSANNDIEAINAKFVQSILINENLCFEDVEITYATDGLASVTYYNSSSEVTIFEPIRPDELNPSNTRIISAAAVYLGLVLVVKAYELASLSCSALQLIDGFDVCAYAISTIKASIGTSKWEVKRTLYKDNACPYPPNSYQCNSSPFAYYVTTYRQV